MTIVPRTGPLSAISALATASWYQRGKSSLCGVRTGVLAIALARYPAGSLPTRGPPRALRAVADRFPARRWGPFGAVQLAVRPPHRGHIHPAHRGHRHRADARGMGRRDPADAAVAGPGLGRGPLPAIAAPASLRRRRREAAREWRRLSRRGRRGALSHPR